MEGEVNECIGHIRPAARIHYCNSITVWLKHISSWPVEGPAGASAAMQDLLMA